MKFLAGLLTLPFCISVTRSLFIFLQAAWEQRGGRAGFWAFLVGFLIWVVLYHSVARPTRTYVLAHELTHALWAFLMGGRVGKLKVSARGGSVALSKTNFLITLAPYFFPLYTVCVLAAYGAVALFIDQEAYRPFWLALLGLSWAFHVTFTLSMLSQRQTDVESCGRLFSYAFTYFANVLTLALALALLSGWGLMPAVEQVVQDGLAILKMARNWREWAASGWWMSTGSGKKHLLASFFPNPG